MIRLLFAMGLVLALYFGVKYFLNERDDEKRKQNMRDEVEARERRLEELNSRNEVLDVEEQIIDEEQKLNEREQSLNEKRSSAK